MKAVSVVAVLGLGALACQNNPSHASTLGTEPDPVFHRDAGDSDSEADDAASVPDTEVALDTDHDSAAQVDAVAEWITDESPADQGPATCVDPALAPDPYVGNSTQNMFDQIGLIYHASFDHTGNGSPSQILIPVPADEYAELGFSVTTEATDPSAHLIWAGNTTSGFGLRITCDDDWNGCFADIVVNDAILIKGLKIVEKNKALFVSMPAEQAKDKKWYDNVRCLKEEVKEQITERVLEAYHS